MFRYVIRRESFGALLYDKIEDCCIAVDPEFFSLLKKLESDFSVTIKTVDSDVIQMLKFECLITDDDKINYRIFEQDHMPGVLSSPPRIHFYYTSRCNLNCVHCFARDRMDDSAPDLTYKEKIQLLDQIESLGISEILIGGGEPFIEEDFCDFVEECLRRGIVTKVFTNGLLINNQLIDRMSKWNIKYLSVSIDGATASEYFLTRKTQGLEQVEDAIRLIHQHCSFSVAISITVNRMNYRNAGLYLELAKYVGADRIKIRPTKPSGNVYKNPEIFPDPEMYVSFIKAMQNEWLANYRDYFTLDYSWGDARLYYSPESNTMEVVNIPFPYNGYGCFAGKASMVIDAKGNAIPCGFLPEAMQMNGRLNIRDVPLKDIWDKGKGFTAFRNLNGNETCLACEYYGMCRGGCIARILFAGRAMTDVDPWCLKDYFPISLG